MFAKKNLVAAAALLAVAGAAQADVKLYGTLDMSVGSYELAHAKGTPSRVTAVDSGDLITSFIGFAGSEDLGGGLKAEFTLESFLKGDTGSSSAVYNKAGGFWGRASNVALSGGFGKVAIGQYDNPLFTSGYTYNPFGSSMLLSPTMRHFYGAFNVGGGVGFDTGWVNSLTYESPVFSGFQGIAQYAPKETTATGTNNSYTLAGSYNAGPLSVMGTYVSAGVGATANGFQAYTAKEKVGDLGVSYDFGVVKAFGQFTKVSDSTNASKDTMYQLGVSVPVTDKAAVLASYGQLKNKATADGSVAAKDSVFTVAYDYVLSKRTDVYGGFSNHSQTKTLNDTAGQSFVAGLRHSF